jgi:hypothetical protein
MEFIGVLQRVARMGMRLAIKVSHALKEWFI